MALFNPPLHKPGIKRCPSCGSPVLWPSISSWWSNGSLSYPCSRCGAALKVDIKRSLLSPALWLVYSALAGWGISYGPSWALVPIIYSTFFFPVLTSWWFTSVRLSEEIPSEKAVWRNPPLCKPGNKRCPNCGSLVKPNTVWYFRPIRRCTRCGAGLRQDKGRAIIGLVIVGTQMASGCLLTSLGRSHEPPMRFWIDLPLAVYMLLLGAAWQWWFVSVTLDGKAALKPGSP